MCNECDESMILGSDDLFDLVVTDRGNFIVSTMDYSDVSLEMGMIPGITHLTNIMVVGNAAPMTRVECALFVSRFGHQEMSAHCIPANTAKDAIVNHEKAVFLASSHDFPWMTVEQIREVIYGFTGADRDALEAL